MTSVRGVLFTAAWFYLWEGHKPPGEHKTNVKGRLQYEQELLKTGKSCLTGITVPYHVRYTAVVNHRHTMKPSPKSAVTRHVLPGNHRDTTALKTKTKTRNYYSPVPAMITSRSEPGPCSQRV